MNEKQFFDVVTNSRISRYVFWSRECVCNISDSHKFRVEKIFKSFLCLLFKRHFDIFSKRRKSHESCSTRSETIKKTQNVCETQQTCFRFRRDRLLKFIVEINDIRMNFAKIATIKKWVESTTRRHVRILIQFAKFYKKFIKKFNKIAKSLTNFLKKKRENLIKCSNLSRKHKKRLKN